MDSSDDDDLLFSYNNKQKLTFSSNVDFTNAKYDSDSDSDSDDDDVVVKDMSPVKHPSDSDVIEVTTPALNPLLKQIAEYNNSVISPSPPPTMSPPKSREKRCARRATRRSKNSAPVDISLLKKRFNASDDEDVVVGDVFVSTPTSTETSTIMLKIRVHGAIEKYEVKRFQPLTVLISDIASKEDVIASHISLSLGNSVIDASKSAKALNLTIADIIECYIHDSNADKENEINVTVRSVKNSSIFAVNLNEPVERVLQEFVRKHHPDVEACMEEKTKFSFDGQPIKNLKSATFVSLDMEDGDIIDVVLT